MKNQRMQANLFRGPFEKLDMVRRPNNLFDDIPASLASELVQSLQEGEGVRIERIVSQGHASPEGFWYDQEQDEWVIVLQGSAKLQFEEPAKTVAMRRGDHLLIRSGQRHRVLWTSPDEPTVWLAVHFTVEGVKCCKAKPTAS